MKVLIISRGVPDDDYPLNGVFEFDQAKALAQADVEVIFFGIDLRSLRRKRKFGYNSGIKNGINWYSINIPLGAVPRFLLLFVGKIAVLLLYNSVFNKHTKRPDVIHAHFTDIGNISSYLSKKKGIPLVVTEHSSEMNKDVISSSLMNSAKKTYNNCARVVAVSKPLANSIKKKTGIICEVIPNVVDTKSFFITNSTKHEKYGFISTGAVCERKRQLMLLEIFHKLHEKHEDIKLGIIGSGPDEGLLKAKTKEYGIEEDVCFFGSKRREEINDIYSGYDCFVLPSSRETFGVVYIEAMAAGLPVIATACGGPEDFITPENGILIPVDDKEQLYNAMEKMYIHRESYDSGCIAKYVYKNFSADSIAEKLIEIYKKIGVK